jgi:hypothetical protein
MCFQVTSYRGLLAPPSQAETLIERQLKSLHGPPGVRLWFYFLRFCGVNLGPGMLSWRSTTELHPHPLSFSLCDLVSASRFKFYLVSVELILPVNFLLRKGPGTVVEHVCLAITSGA